jgi:hypothetical protein
MEKSRFKNKKQTLEIEGKEVPVLMHISTSYR